MKKKKNNSVVTPALCVFISLRFRYEKQRSNFVSCLERAESAEKPDTQHLSADKVKLHAEIQDLQVRRFALNFIHDQNLRDE